MACLAMRHLHPWSLEDNDSQNPRMGCGASVSVLAEASAVKIHVRCICITAMRITDIALLFPAEGDPTAIIKLPSAGSGYRLFKTSDGPLGSLAQGTSTTDPLHAARYWRSGLSCFFNGRYKLTMGPGCNSREEM